MSPLPYLPGCPGSHAWPPFARLRRPFPPRSASGLPFGALSLLNRPASLAVIPTDRESTRDRGGVGQRAIGLDGAHRIPSTFRP